MSGAVSASAAIATAVGATETAAAITAFGAGTGGAVLSGLGALSTAAGAFGAIQQGRAGAESADYSSQVAANNALIQQQNANYASAAGEQQAANQEQKNRAKLGAVVANQAASGVDVNSGSAVDVQQSTAELGQLDATTIRANAAKQAYGYQVDSASQTAQSQLDKYQAKNDEDAGIEKAGTIIGANAEKASQSGLWGNFLSGNSIDPNFVMGTAESG